METRKLLSCQEIVTCLKVFNLYRLRPFTSKGKRGDNFLIPLLHNTSTLEIKKTNQLLNEQVTQDTPHRNNNNNGTRKYYQDFRSNRKIINFDKYRYPNDEIFWA